MNHTTFISNDICFVDSDKAMELMGVISHITLRRNLTPIKYKGRCYWRTSEINDYLARKRSVNRTINVPKCFDKKSDRNDFIRKLRSNGYAIKEIEKAMNLKHSTVVYICRNVSIKNKNDLIRKFYDDGMSVQEICYRFRKNRQKIEEILNEI